MFFFSTRRIFVRPLRHPSSSASCKMFGPAAALFRVSDGSWGGTGGAGGRRRRWRKDENKRQNKVRRRPTGRKGGREGEAFSPRTSRRRRPLSSSFLLRPFPNEDKMSLYMYIYIHVYVLHNQILSFLFFFFTYLFRVTRFIFLFKAQDTKKRHEFLTCIIKCGIIKCGCLFCHSPCRRCFKARRIQLPLEDPALLGVPEVRAPPTVRWARPCPAGPYTLEVPTRTECSTWNIEFAVNDL